MKKIKEALAISGITKKESVEQTMEPFSLDSLFDFRDSFDDNALALRTLGELIANSNPGLEILIELCLKKQEENLKDLLEKALNSPEKIIERARKVILEIEIGSIIYPAKSSIVTGAVVDLDNIISMFGSERYPEAETIKMRIFSKIDSDKYHHIGNGTDG